MATVEGKITVIVVDEDAVTRARGFAIEGLQMDGGHHKQWYLEQIAEALGADLDTIDFDPGIPG